MRSAIGTRKDISRIINEGWLYVKKEVKDLTGLQGSNIRIYVNGREIESEARVSSNNRISGLGCLSDVLKGHNQFTYYFGEQKRALIINLPKLQSQNENRDPFDIEEKELNKTETSRFVWTPDPYDIEQEEIVNLVKKESGHFKQKKICQ